MEEIKFGYLMKIFTEYDDKLNIDKNARKLNVSYSWLYKALKEIEDKDLLITEKVGRQTRVKFTSKGEKVRRYFEEIRRILYDSNLS